MAVVTGTFACGRLSSNVNYAKSGKIVTISCGDNNISTAIPTGSEWVGQAVLPNGLAPAAGWKSYNVSVRNGVRYGIMVDSDGRLSIIAKSANLTTDDAIAFCLTYCTK